MTANFLSQLAGSGNLIVQITANDLKEFVRELYSDEQKKVQEALAKQREEPALSRRDTAKRLNVSLATLWKWAKEGYLVPVKIGTKVMYKASDVDELLTKYSQTN